MNIIKNIVNFEKGIVIPEGIDLITGDYASTKIIFTFDKEEGTKIFKMKSPSGKLILFNEIVNNEILLCGYDENEKPYSLFNEEGDYVYEISLYDGKSKLTSAHGVLPVNPEQVTGEEEEVEPYLPVFDSLMTNIDNALNNVDKALEDITLANEEANQIIEDFEQDINDYTEEFDNNALQKTTEFNANASQKTSEFNTNASQKTSEVNQIYSNTQQLVNGFDTKVNNATTTLNKIVSDAEEIYDDFETNANQKTEDFNNNSSNKNSEFNTNVSEKTDEFNTNATSKTATFDNNALQKTTEFNENAETKIAYFDSHAESIEKDLNYWKKTWNAHPKVTGTGTDITLDDTAEDTPMQMGLKASDSYQETTTGKNIFNAETNIIGGANQDTLIQNNSTGTVFISRTNSAFLSKYFAINNLEIGKTYTLQLDVQAINCTFNNNKGLIRIGSVASVDSYDYGYYDGTTSFSNITLTFVATTNTLSITLYGANGTAPSGTATMTAKNIQLEEGPTKTNFEPYTGGQASPNPDFPQDIEVVSGDNEIKVENKNLLSGNATSSSQNCQPISTNDIKTNALGNYGWFNIIFDSTIELSAGTTYYISLDCKLISGTGNKLNYLKLANENSWAAVNNPVFTSNYQRYVFTYTPTSNINNSTILCQIVSGNNCVLELTNFMISTTSDFSYEPHQESTYPVNLGDMELVKLPNTDYQDEIRRSTGKNLFDKDKILKNKTTNSSGVINNGKLFVSDYIEVKKNITYTLKDNSNNAYGLVIDFYDKDKNFISELFNSGTTKQTIFTTNQDGYVIVRPYWLSTETAEYQEIVAGGFQLEKGSSATDYEPYGVGKWYKYAEVGKVVLDGSENIENNQNYISIGRFNITSITNTKGGSVGNPNAISTHFLSKYETANRNIYVGFNSDICLIDTDYSNDLAGFKSWLGTNNPIVYYVLATPTTTEITDTTLIEQLDAIYYATSYQDQTNISQTNDGRPFVIDAVTLYDGNKILTRLANLELE